MRLLYETWRGKVEACNIQDAVNIACTDAHTGELDIAATVAMMARIIAILYDKRHLADADVMQLLDDRGFRVAD